MTKNIIKEIIIMLLLCLAILLVLGILLYEYVPMTKTIPNPVSYATPENVKQELAKTTEVEEDQIIMTYEVDSTDLNNYKRTQDYKPGKANPFSSYEPEGSTAGTDTTKGKSATTEEKDNNTTNSSQKTQENTTSQDTNTSGGKFFQNKGTK